MKTINELKQEFGNRICTLNTGAIGIRGGIQCTVRELAGDEPVMEFIGSDGTVDRYNEVIDPLAWGDMKNFRANPVIPDCHDYSSIVKILGRAESVSVNSAGQLVNRVRFCLDNPMGSLAYKMAKSGFIKSQSVGFIPQEWVNGKSAAQPDRTYTKVELLEISLVVVPAKAANDARSIEMPRLAQAEAALSTADAYRKRQAEATAERTRLMDEAGTAAGRAAVLRGEVTTDSAFEGRQNGTDAEVARLHQASVGKMAGASAQTVRAVQEFTATTIGGFAEVHAQLAKSQRELEAVRRQVSQAPLNQH